MKRRDATPAEVRAAAAKIVREQAHYRELDGDPEGAGVMRDTAKLIDKMRLTVDVERDPETIKPRWKR